MRCLGVIPLLLSLALAWPTSLNSSLLTSRQSSSIFEGQHLHILPLGASITYGQKSSDGDGYRLVLRNMLSPAEVTYVGTQCSGTMSNANNEGRPGWLIHQMRMIAAPNYIAQPNVVIIYVGTNDMKYGKPLSAPADMNQLILALQANLPSTLIIVSKLFPTSDPKVSERIATFNSQMDSMLPLGNVMMADFTNVLTVADLGPDGTHPTDEGYGKMAGLFHDVLVEAQRMGRIPRTTGFDFPAQKMLCNGPGPDAPPPPASTTATQAPAAQPATSTTQQQPQAQAQQQTSTTYSSTSTTAVSASSSSSSSSASSSSSSSSTPTSTSSSTLSSSTITPLSSPTTLALSSSSSSTPSPSASSTSGSTRLMSNLPASAVGILALSGAIAVLLAVV